MAHTYTHDMYVCTSTRHPLNRAYTTRPEMDIHWNAHENNWHMSVTSEHTNLYNLITHILQCKIYADNRSLLIRHLSDTCVSTDEYDTHILTNITQMHQSSTHADTSITVTLYRMSQMHRQCPQSKNNLQIATSY